MNSNNCKDYIQFNQSLPLFDLEKYQCIQLISNQNHNIYVYDADQSVQPQIIAVKEIPVEPEQEEILIKRLIETYRVQSTNHKNLTQIYGFNCKMQNYQNGTQKKYYLVCMEYLPYNLQDRIDYFRQINSVACKQEFLDTLIVLNQAFQYLQLLNYCHTDIKPQNILIDSLENPKEYKICDFDNLSIFKDNTHYQSYNITTFIYQSPEIREAISQGYDQISYNAYKSEIYSLGLCIIQIHCKINLDLILDNQYERFQQYASRIISKFYGKKLGQIIKNMLDLENSKRPDFIKLGEVLNNKKIDSANVSKQFIEEAVYDNLINCNESRDTIDMNERKQNHICIYQCGSIQTISSNTSKSVTPIGLNAFRRANNGGGFSKFICDLQLEEIKNKQQIDEDIQEQISSSYTLIHRENQISNKSNIKPSIFANQAQQQKQNTEKLTSLKNILILSDLITNQENNQDAGSPMLLINNNQQSVRKMSQSFSLISQ